MKAEDIIIGISLISLLISMLKFMDTAHKMDEKFKYNEMYKDMVHCVSVSWINLAIVFLSLGTIFGIAFNL
jgi:uncharacterized membrane protein YidH (DUF202 family)